MDRDPEAQIQAKVTHVERSLERSVDAVHRAPDALAYRSRITLRPGPEGAWSYSPPRSHDRVPVRACPIARPELELALASLPPVQGARSVELRSDGREVVLVFEGGGRSALEKLHGPWRGVARGRQEITGDSQITLEVAGLQLQFGPRTFYQVHLEMNSVLVGRVREEVLELAPEALLELYSGAGNLGLPLAAAGVPVTSIESHPGAVRDARRNAETAGLSPHLVQANADRAQPGEHPFDVLLLDPPRAGAPGVLEALAMARPRGIVYVSCNTRSLARDLRPLRATGYGIHRLEVLDMFPQTPHTEVLCVLHRN